MTINECARKKQLLLSYFLLQFLLLGLRAVVAVFGPHPQKEPGD